MKILVTFIVLLLLTHSCSLLAANKKRVSSLSEDWTYFPNSSETSTVKTKSPGLVFQLKPSRLELLLSSDKTFEFDVPLPNGNFVTYVLSQSNVMHEALAAKYPNIKTYSGYQKGAPYNRGLFDATNKGLHGVIRFETTTIYIDPIDSTNPYEYLSYDKNDLESTDRFRVNKSLKRMPIIDKVNRKLTSTNTVSAQNLVTAGRQSQSLRTLRLAIATTGEYSQFHGGTKASVLSSLVTLVNRVNQVYRQDLGVQFELIATNDDIIFLNTETDPFNNTDDDLDIVQAEMDRRIAIENYDIGHLVTTGGGGIASLGAVCTRSKFEGLTGSELPINDGFYIDYVAHEIGHQLGADHIFNGHSGGCEDNRVDDSAYEPGSGNTIMGYAGLCGLQDIARSTDAHFHIHSIDQITQTLNQAGNCGSLEPLSTVPQTANAGVDYSIPAKTPFELRAYNIDSNDIAANYSWYQMDLGAKTTTVREDKTDNGAGPLFKSFLPTATAVRSFPQISDVLNNKLTYGEVYPSTSRELNFRLVVRDNQGQLADDSVKLDVVDVDEGFYLEQPTMQSNNEMILNWNIAGTDQAPVSCAKVSVLLSTNSGESFDKVLVSGTDNDGEEIITVSNVETQFARIKLICDDNVFYAINPQSFALNVEQVEGVVHQDYVPNTQTEHIVSFNSTPTSTDDESDLDIEQKTDQSGGATYLMFGLAIFIFSRRCWHRH